MNPFRKMAVALTVVAAVMGGAWMFGTPHLRITYNTWECRYFGANGWELDGVGASCPLVKIFPRR